MVSEWNWKKETPHKTWWRCHLPYHIKFLITIVEYYNSTGKGQKKSFWWKIPTNKMQFTKFQLNSNSIGLNTFDNRIWIESSMILIMCKCMSSRRACVYCMFWLDAQYSTNATSFDMSWIEKGFRLPFVWVQFRMCTMERISIVLPTMDGVL